MFIAFKLKLVFKDLESLILKPIKMSIIINI